MSSMTFVINDSSTGTSNPLVQVNIVQNGDGTVTFTVTQLVYAGAYLGDLRGLFFDLGRESLIGTLSVVGAPAYFTEIAQGNDTVKDLGQGANMQGLLGSDGGYDVGIEIGTSGIGKDDVRSFSFTLSSSSGPLTLNDFAEVDFGVRITSVGRDIDGNGTIDTARNNSAKIGETTDPIAGNTDDGDATVTITGTAQEDSVLTAAFNNNDPDGAASGISYQWQRDGVGYRRRDRRDLYAGRRRRRRHHHGGGELHRRPGLAESIESAPTAAVPASTTRRRDGDDQRDGAGEPRPHARTSLTRCRTGGAGISYQWQRDGVGHRRGDRPRPICWATPTSAPPSRWW